jgi:hypothetical protein
MTYRVPVCFESIVWVGGCLTVLLNDLSVQHGVVVDMKVVRLSLVELSLVETFVSIGCQ